MTREEQDKFLAENFPEGSYSMLKLAITPSKMEPFLTYITQIGLMLVAIPTSESEVTMLVRNENLKEFADALKKSGMKMHMPDKIKDQMEWNDTSKKGPLQ